MAKRIKQSKFGENGSHGLLGKKMDNMGTEGSQEFLSEILWSQKSGSFKMPSGACRRQLLWSDIS